MFRHDAFLFGVSSVGVLRLSLPFATNATDTSGNAIPTRTAQGTPSYSGGALLLDSTDMIATGSADGQVQSTLDTTGKGWQIEFDVQMIDTTANRRIFVKNIATGGTPLPALFLEQSTSKLILKSHSNQSVFDVNVGLDMSAAFFNVKMVKLTDADYPKLYINNVLLATYAFSGNVLGDSTTYAGFYFGTSSNSAGFKIKNFKFYTT